MAVMVSPTGAYVTTVHAEIISDSDEHLVEILWWFFVFVRFFVLFCFFLAFNQFLEGDIVFVRFVGDGEGVDVGLLDNDVVFVT